MMTKVLALIAPVAARIVSVATIYAGLFFAASAWALVPPSGSLTATYNPNTVQSINIEQPTTWSYNVSLTAPTAIAFPVTVTLQLNVQSAPAGVSTATAASFIRFSQPTITFTAGGQVQTFTVTATSPIGAPTGDFAYYITVSGWPSNVIDNGTFINMHATPPSTLLTPSVQIRTPANGANYTHVLGGDPVLVPIDIAGTAAPAVPVTVLIGSISGVDVGGAVILPSTPLVLTLTGLGSPQTDGLVQFPVSKPGTYTINAVATNVIGTAQTSSIFTVDESVPPPTVIITQPPSATYDYHLGSPALQIPFTFQGHSLKGGIRTLSATLNGVPVAITTTDIGTLVATGTGLFNLTTGGDYVLQVTATDDYGTATASTNFTINVITVPSNVSVRGTVFFDVNSNGVLDGEEYGLPGVSVKLTSSTGQIVTATTNADGLYQFNPAAGSYTVSVQRPVGFSLTTANNHHISAVSTAITAPNTGYALNFCEIAGLTANGYSQGYWKTNIDKALCGRTNGIQVSVAALKAFTAAIAQLGLDPFDGETLKKASDTFGSTSSDTKSQLSKQLLAAEYNYANGAFLGGNATLTYAFIYYGEYVLEHASSYKSSYLNSVSDWFESYDNSHGGVVGAPAGSDCGSSSSTCDRDSRDDSRCGSDRDSDHNSGSDSHCDSDHESDRDSHCDSDHDSGSDSHCDSDRDDRNNSRCDTGRDDRSNYGDCDSRDGSDSRNGDSDHHNSNCR